MTTTPWYASREEIKAELDVKETARSNARIDRALADATDAVHGLTHRIFYPVLATRRFDWPARAGGQPGVLRLDSNEVISVVSLKSGGNTIPSDQYILRRADNRDEPPYTRIELRQDTSASFGQGDTWQEDIDALSLFGFRNDETTLGTTTEALDLTETGITVDATTSAAVGVGNLLRIGDERVIITGRTQAYSGQTLGADLPATNSATTITVADATAYAVDEVILIDGERMRIDDLADTTLVVQRAVDGTTLAAHSQTEPIYAPRTLTVVRGALGTTAALHDTAAPVYRWDPPGSVRQLCVAEAVTDLLQGRSGYARTAGSGDNERETSGRGLADLRERVYVEFGRKARMRSI